MHWFDDRYRPLHWFVKLAQTAMVIEIIILNQLSDKMGGNVGDKRKSQTGVGYDSERGLGIKNKRGMGAYYGKVNIFFLSQFINK